MSSTDIYQIYCNIAGISPMVWRRILIKNDSSIATLHRIMQLSFGWDDTYQHCFTIRAKEYGIEYIGGLEFIDDADLITLSHFVFDIGETFKYEYNFFSYWEVNIRLEKMLGSDPKIEYPKCIAGKRYGPLEYCNGPREYMEKSNKYINPKVAFLELFEFLNNFNTKEDDINNCRDLVVELNHWTNVENFDRKKLNKLLIKYANDAHNWDEYILEECNL